MEKSKKFILYITSVPLILCLAWIFVHAVSEVPAANNMFAGKNMTLILLTGGLLLLFVLLMIGRLSRNMSVKQLKIAAAVILAVILTAQLVYLKLVQYFVGYDNVLVLSEVLSMMENGGKISGDFYGAYFQRYMHNHPITILLYWILSAAKKLGIFDVHWTPCLFGVFCMDTALLFAWKYVRESKGIRMGFLFCVFCLINPILYIWTSWHYTTVTMLPFLSGSLYFLYRLIREKHSKKTVLYAVLFGLFMALGMRIRITLAIFLIAVILSVIFLKGYRKLKLKSMLLPAVLAFAAVWVITGAVNKQYKDFDESDWAVTPAHYLMMGLGETGSFNPADVAYTNTYKGKAAKTEADIAEIKNRLGNMGVSGLARLVGKKMLITWEDGSCGFVSAWLYPLNDSRVYLYFAGEKSDPFLAYCQMNHVLILGLAIFGTAAALRRRKTGFELVLRLTFLGNIVFYMFWEAQNHYSIGMLFAALLLALDGFGYMQEDALAAGEQFIIPGISKKKRLYTGTFVLLFVLLAALLYKPIFSEPLSWHEYAAVGAYETGTISNLTDGDVITQSFTTKTHFNRIWIQASVADPDEPEGSCLIELLDEDGNVIASQNRTADEIASTMLNIEFEVIQPQKETVYTIRLSVSGMDEEHAMSLSRFDGTLDLYPGGSVTINSKEEPGDLRFYACYDKTEQTPYSSAAAGILSKIRGLFYKPMTIDG